MMQYLLAIDQGTTNSRAMIFHASGKIIAQHELTLKQYYPQDGWVEQNPQEMFDNTITCCQTVLNQAKLTAKNIAAIGISNQRETTIIWDKQTGQAIYPAIVWQDRRTVALCKQFDKPDIVNLLYQKTGLLLDPYFSATKIIWILNHVEHARERAERGELLFGTVDSYLLWKLTNGKTHATDATNAARTLIFNIHTQTWDQTILDLFDIPVMMLPTVLDNTADFGKVDSQFFGEVIPITGMAGDQQAAAIGQTCFSPGMVKVTYGTGGFMLLNTGEQVVQSHNRLLSTIAYRINNKVTYAIEGSFFSAGSIIKWFRDQLHLIKTAAESETCANKVENTEGVYLVPAFTGLGAPYWQPEARAAIVGMTHNTNVNHLVRAGLESVVYQTRDLLDIMQTDSEFNIDILRVDGGMAVNAWLMQFLADMLNIEVQRPQCIETTALGAAYLAGLQIGIYASLDDIKKLWEKNQSFVSDMTRLNSDKLYGGWKKAITMIIDRKKL